jgi:hypothetical protein
MKTRIAASLSILTCLTVSSASHAEYLLPPKGAQIKTTKPKVSGSHILSRTTPILDGVFIALGTGFDSVTGDYKPNECVRGTGANQPFGQGELSGTISRKRILAVSNMTDNREASGSEIGFGFAYKLVSFGFGSGSSSSTYFNSVDQYARAYVREAVKGEALRNPVWSNVGKRFVPSSDPKSVKNFTDKCGTHYVRAVYFGHILDQVYRFKTNASSITTGGKNDLSVGVGKIFSLDYSDASSATKISNNAQIVISGDSRGIGENASRPADATALAALVKYADETFSKEAKAASNKAVLILVELQPYNTIPDSSNVPDWPNNIMGLVASRIDLYERLLTYVGDLSFAAGLPDPQLTALYEDNLTSVTNKATAAQALRDDFGKATQYCKDLLDKGVNDATGTVACSDKMSNAISEAKVAAVRLKLK